MANTSADLEPLLASIVARAKTAIVADVRDGTVPRTVRTVGGLGSYVDQNLYFLDADGNFDPELDALCVDIGNGTDGEMDCQPMWDFLGRAQERVDAWMQSGALLRIPVRRAVRPSARTKPKGRSKAAGRRRAKPNAGEYSLFEAPADTVVFDRVPWSLLERLSSRDAVENVLLDAPVAGRATPLLALHYRGRVIAYYGVRGRAAVRLPNFPRVGRPWPEEWAQSVDGRALIEAADPLVPLSSSVLAACACARLVLDEVPRGERRPLAAIEAAEAWARGAGVTTAQVAAAASDAYQAYLDLERAAAAAYSESRGLDNRAALAAHAAANAAGTHAGHHGIALRDVRAVRVGSYYPTDTAQDKARKAAVSAEWDLRMAALVRAHIPFSAVVEGLLGLAPRPPTLAEAKRAAKPAPKRAAKRNGLAPASQVPTASELFALGARYGAEAARRTVQDRTREEMQQAARDAGRPARRLLVDDARELATYLFGDDATAQYLPSDLDARRNRDALWDAFGRGVASTAAPVIAAALAARPVPVPAHRTARHTPRSHR